MIFAYNTQELAWGDRGGSEYYLVKGTEGTERKYLNIVPGISGQYGTVSFQDPLLPSFYLRVYNYKLYMQNATNPQNSQTFATFFVRKNHFFEGYESYESTQYANYFIRHSYYRMIISKHDRSLIYDASFRPVLYGAV